MSTIVNARKRYEKLDRLARFPQFCERCRVKFTNYDDVSVIKIAHGAMVVHTKCRRLAQMEADRGK